MKYIILLVFLFCSSLNANYFVYEDKSNKATLDFIKDNHTKLFTKTSKSSMGASQSSIWLRITLTNYLSQDSLQYIRFREAFLYQLELYDDKKVLKGGSSIPYDKRQLPLVSDTFEILVPANAKKIVFIKVVPKYNATYAYDIFTSKDELISHNSFFEYVFISYLSIMGLIFIGSILVFLLFREKFIAYYIFFIAASVVFQVFQSGFILSFANFSNIVKYDEIFALILTIGITLFLKTFFKEQVEKYSLFKYLMMIILSACSFGVILLIVNFNFYIDLLVELVILNFSLISLLLFLIYMVIKKVKYSIFALAGMFIFLNSSLVCAFYYIGLVDNRYALVIMQIASIIESLAFLSLLFYRIYNHLIEEKIKSDKYTFKLNDMQLLAKMGTWTYSLKENYFLIDEPAKKILEFNKDILDFTTFTNLLHPDEKEKTKILQKQIILNQNINEHTFRILTKSKNLKYISFHWKFNYSNNRELTHIDGYIMDITEKVLAQQEVESQHALLLHQQKLAQQGEMLSMIAHQWRQPLTAISATISNLLLKNIIHQNINSKELSEELKLVSNYTQHLSSTIDDFRYYFKVEKEKKSASLEDLLERSINIIKISIDSNDIEIVRNYNCKKNITSYTNEIQQVILNLLNNAKDALIERNIKDKKIFIETNCDGKYAFLIINDNSGGIKDKFLKKVFEPYFSTKRNHDGTGLGLYMSRMIINEHCGGEISVKNNEYGARFLIKLKLDEIN